MNNDTNTATNVPTMELRNDATIDDPMDPALDPYRPNPSVVDEYVDRDLPGGYKGIEYLLNVRDDRFAPEDLDPSKWEPRPNVALVGPTQSGKTMLMQVLAVLAAERDGLPKPYPLFTLNGSSSISNYDLFGKPCAVIVDGKEVLVWMEGVVPLAIRSGSMLYLDEWNAVAPSQAVALHGVLDDRRQFTNTHRAVPNGAGGWMPEVVKAHHNLWIVATINPQGYKGTQAMPEATTNRFRWLDWGYDEKVESTIIKSDAVRDLALRLRNEYDLGVLRTPVGTSALYRLNMDIATYGVDAALAVFSSMFQNRADRAKLEEIIERGNMMDRLNEYSTRLRPPEGAKS